MTVSTKILICVEDDDIDCKVIELKLMEFVEKMDSEKLKRSKISLHMPECNLINFVHKEKEFTKNILSKRMMVKFNQKMIEHNLDKKEVTIERSDRAGNKDTFVETYDEILIIGTNQQ